MKNNFTAIILAAGLGRRMNSPISKVLHSIGNKPMIVHTLEVVKSVSPKSIVVVANSSNVNELKKVLDGNIAYRVQKKQLGTADATKVGMESLNKDVKTVAVFYGDDTAFYDKKTIASIIEKHDTANAAVTFITLHTENPSGLGRVIRENGKLTAIAEEKDAQKNQLKTNEVNDGVYVFDKIFLEKNIGTLKPSPVSGEYYLTDLINEAIKQRKKVETLTLEDPQQWHGINTPEQLESANQKFNSKTQDTNRIHIMGIAGAGAAAIAGIAKNYGFIVSGCDLVEHSTYLGNIDVAVQKGHSPAHLAEVDMLIISPAITKLNPKNEEVQQAKKLKIPVLTWQEFQGKYLQAGKFVITVAGAYGKSTTTSMIAQIMTDLGLDPTVEIGARVTKWQSNFRVGKSKYYVCESDEYNNNFLNYNPNIAVILNTGWDHPDFFKTKESVITAYKNFIKQIVAGGTLIIPADLEKLAKTVRPDVEIVKIGDFGNLNLSIIGDFRKENAAAALTVAKALNLDLKNAKRSVESFSGVGRRLEYKGEVAGVKLYDDYAVQPHTVLKTANALKEKFKNKKVALIFEPHTFSRIETFFKDFVASLKKTQADKIFVTDVYPAREKGNVSALSKKLASAVGPKAKYTGTLKSTADFLKKEKSFDVMLSMGAGNSYKFYDLYKNG